MHFFEQNRIARNLLCRRWLRWGVRLCGPESDLFFDWPEGERTRNRVGGSAHAERGRSGAGGEWEAGRRSLARSRKAAKGTKGD